MKRLIFVTFVAFGIFLIGCDDSNYPAKFKPLAEPITLYILSDKEINKRNKELGYNDKVDCFALWREGGSSRHCRIFVPPPNDANAIDTLLHEIRHCQEGEYHK